MTQPIKTKGDLKEKCMEDIQGLRIAPQPIIGDPNDGIIQESHAEIIFDCMQLHIEQTIHQEKINLIGFCKRRANEHRALPLKGAINKLFVACFEAIAKELGTAKTDLDALYQFEAGQDDGKIEGWNEAIDKAIDSTKDFILTLAMKNKKFKLSKLVEKLKELKRQPQVYPIGTLVPMKVEKHGGETCLR